MDIQIEIELQDLLKQLKVNVTFLSNLQKSGIGVEEELMDVEFEGSSLNTFSNLNTIVATLMPKIDPDDSWQMMKEKIETNKKRAEDLYMLLIRVGLDCLKYNLPKLEQFQELGVYEKELQKYTKKLKDEAKLNREKGQKNVKELLQQLHQSSQEGHSLTFEEVKLVIMGTRVNLTRLLVDFLFLGSPTTQKLAKRLQLFRTTLRCLTVEDNSNIIVDAVLNILEEAQRKAMEEKLIVTSSRDEGNGSSSYMSREEGDIFRKILREFARFEVNFCCPSLPSPYSNEDLTDMVNLFKRRSEEKINRISYKIGELTKVEKATTGSLGEDLKMNQFKHILREICDNIDLS